MKTSCIRHPESSRFIQLYAWQKDFCQGDHCAALLLSFFSAWHDWKIQNDHYYHHFNDIAEAHADSRPHNDTNIKPILDASAEKGFSAERFQYPDVIDAVQKLQQAGADVEYFIKAYKKTKRSKGMKPFAARYLIKIVERILNNKQKSIHLENYSTNQKEYVFLEK